MPNVRGDARRCIAFHTIRDRDARFAGGSAPAMGPWVAGCDICQDGPAPGTTSLWIQQQRSRICNRSRGMLDLKAEEALAGATALGQFNCGLRPAPHQALDCGAAICWLAAAVFFGPS